MQGVSMSGNITSVIGCNLQFFVQSTEISNIAYWIRVWVLAGVHRVYLSENFKSLFSPAFQQKKTRALGECEDRQAGKKLWQRTNRQEHTPWTDLYDPGPNVNGPFLRYDQPGDAWKQIFPLSYADERKVK